MTEPYHKPKPEERKISAQLEFTNTGYLKAILLNADGATDQATLERALDRLFKPQHSGWVRRLFTGRMIL